MLQLQVQKIRQCVKEYIGKLVGDTDKFNENGKNINNLEKKKNLPMNKT